MLSIAVTRRERPARTVPSGYDHSVGHSGTDNGSIELMSGSQKTFRLSVGLFSDPVPLNAAICELSGQGLEAVCFCFIGAFHTLNNRLWRAEHEPQLRNLFEDLREIRGLLDVGSCFASSGPLLDELSVSLKSSEEGRCLRLDWLSGAQVERLAGHLQNGGLVLIVSSASPAQQDASCRSLLKHSKHGVQTHDFTLRESCVESSQKVILR